MSDVWVKTAAVAQAAAAVGAFAAVATSLILARRETRPKLVIDVAMMSSTDAIPVRFVQVRIANAGPIPSQVIGFGWLVGRRNRDYYLQRASQSLVSARLPIVIGPGESATFMYEAIEFAAQNLDMFLALRMRVHWWAKTPPVWLYVGTATQHIVKARVPANLVRWMLTPLPEADEHALRGRRPA